MLKKLPIVLISILLISNNIQSQINPATARRDWLVGHYVGTLKDSVPNIVINCSMNVVYGQTDSIVSIPIGGLSGVVCIDSTLGNDRFCANWPFNQYKFGRLLADSSALFSKYSMGGCGCQIFSNNFCDPGHSMIFRGKKVSDTPLSVNEAELEPNNIAIYPNPIVGNYFNILTLAEIDDFILFDILGKEYFIQSFKTNNGYKIQLPQIINSGIYFLHIKKGNSIVTKKIIVNNT